MCRNGKKWTINEILSLQRQYELLDLSVEQIAKLHDRTVESISYKISSEGFFCSLYGKKMYEQKKDIKRRKEFTGMKLRNGKYKN